MSKPIQGFSKLTKAEKINWVAETHGENPSEFKATLDTYNHSDPEIQKIHDEFIENTLTNHYLPLGVAPNFLIDGKWYTIPMAIEESSVVAAASKAAKFWSNRGGFKTEILGTEKVGQIHLNYHGSAEKLNDFFNDNKLKFLNDLSSITDSMERRGGGIKNLQLISKTTALDGYYQIDLRFETADAMGANFINTCLETLAKSFTNAASSVFEADELPEVVMSILSNYVPNCLVRASVSAPVDQLGADLSEAQLYTKKFVRAVAIAREEPYRAVTHNKGIMNGVDAVVIATGNDFRAVEAGVHAYAAKDGKYRSLSQAKIENDTFHFYLDIPLALGTVGGLTSLHPLVKRSLEILDKPSAKELMRIVAVAGLAQNFAAINSLVTTGIQKGHMKMHLLNLLSALGATEAEKQTISKQFNEQIVTNSAVKEALTKLRNDR
jgi:hydroxymethylglutaryl-CoA reductase